MKYKLTIFDLDGTILDTLADLTASVNFALEQCGFPLRTHSEIRSFLGNGVVPLLTKSVPDGTSQDDIDMALAHFRAHYKIHCNDATSPYDGIPELFEELHQNGCFVAVVSNKPDTAVQILCSRHFPGMLDAVTGERSGVRKKPAPDSINDILSKLSVDVCDSVYIGDSEVDIQTAANAKMNCISVDWGFRTHDFLVDSGAQMIASDINEIKAMLI